jgi:predicted nucleotidyltransferase
MEKPYPLPPFLLEKAGPLLDHLPQFKKRYGIRNIGFFGSYVRGNQTPESDLDVLVEIGNPEMSLLDFIRLENDISDLIGIPVDLVDQSTLKPALEGRILDEVVYL